MGQSSHCGQPPPFWRVGVLSVHIQGNHINFWHGLGPILFVVLRLYPKAQSSSSYDTLRGKGAFQPMSLAGWGGAPTAVSSRELCPGLTAVLHLLSRSCLGSR